MGMLTAMYAGVNGLNVHGKALSSVADNIANVNTHGFKSTRVNFGDLMVHALTAGGSISSNVGTGSRVMNVQNMMTQGSFEGTDIPTDLAINGSGFFEVSNPNEGNNAGFYYTRAGQFTIDAEGYMVNPLGYRLRGYNVDDDGNIVQQPTDLRIRVHQTDAIKTENVELSINLDAEDEDEHKSSEPIDPTDTNTWNYLTSVRTYDTLGVAHDLTTIYQKIERDSYPSGGPFPTGADNDVTPSEITGIWKVAVYEQEDGTFDNSNIQSPTTYFLHFDTDGHLVGTTTGLPDSGDSYESKNAFASGLNTKVSERVGETFNYTAVGAAQEFVSSVDVVMDPATWDASGDTFGVGSTTYTYDNFGTVTELVAAINGNASTSGIWADLAAGGTTISLYGNGDTAANITTSASVTATVTGSSLNHVVDAINNGDTANGAIYVTGATVPAATDLYVNGTTVSVAQGTTMGALATQLETALEGGAGDTWSVKVIGQSIFFEANQVGTAYNVDLSSSDTASIKGLKGDQAAGGMDTGTDTRVLASVDSDNKFTLSHTSTGLAATVTIGTNTLGTSENGADFSTWVQETYANDGEAQNTTHNDSKQPMTFLWKDETGAGEPQEITFDYKPTGSSASASTQSAGASEVLYLFQDGSTRGTLDSLTISDDGEITGNFSNGTLQTLGSIYLAGFADAGSLERSGENLWSKTRDSGQPNINNPNQGGMGKLQSRALEQSNVDLAEQFVKMINYQRAFQANSRTISTTDQMLNELVNLKR